MAPASAADVSGEARQQHADIFIPSNDQFDRTNGVRSGTGTRKDPYVISGWDIRFLEIKDTSKHVVIRNNTIDHLVLDWIGGGAHVYDNVVGDLRVNQNVKRTGDMTSGVIRNNRFDVVGQLRHWDGVFEHNQVGDADSCTAVPFISCRAVNFDGFNGAKFRNNNIFGYVEVRLHGHHHSSSFSEDHSHYHGAGHMDKSDHTTRFHRVSVTNNTIHSGDYWGLIYTDSAHSANDRTAASETNEELNKPHVHTTKVAMNNNEIYGAGIEVDIFNADDERHTATRTGSMQIKNNKIQIQRKEMQADEAFNYKDGILIRRATDLKLSIVRNRIDGAYDETDPLKPVREEFDQGVGINLQDIDKAKVYLLDNIVSSRTFAISASQMTKTVEWWISGLKADGVQQEVHYDSSVANKPHRRP